MGITEKAATLSERYQIIDNPILSLPPNKKIFVYLNTINLLFIYLFKGSAIIIFIFRVSELKKFGNSCYSILVYLSRIMLYHIIFILYYHYLYKYIVNWIFVRIKK